MRAERTDCPSPSKSVTRAVKRSFIPEEEGTATTAWVGGVPACGPYQATAAEAAAPLVAALMQLSAQVGTCGGFLVKGTT